MSSKRDNDGDRPTRHVSNRSLHDLEDTLRKPWRLTPAPLRHQGIPIEGIPKML
jgi:hypothetical protein